MFVPRLDMLPVSQQALWPELALTPPDFTLYGGTAIALRLAHRFSADFGFFSTRPFAPSVLKDSVPYLHGGTTLQSAANTLTVAVERDGPVRLSYFGGLGLGQVEAAETVAGPAFPVASLLDLGGMKVAVVTQRAELKDYLDIHALLTLAGFDLPTMLAAAAVIYGDDFNPLIALKAISYHGDRALAGLAAAVRKDLLAAVRATKLEALPQLAGVRQREARA